MYSTKFFYSSNFLEKYLDFLSPHFEVHSNFDVSGQARGEEKKNFDFPYLDP